MYKGVLYGKIIYRKHVFLTSRKITYQSSSSSLRFEGEKDTRGCKVLELVLNASGRRLVVILALGEQKTIRPHAVLKSWRTGPGRCPGKSGKVYQEEADAFLCAKIKLCISDQLMLVSF